MKNGLYKVINFDERGKKVCYWNDTNIGDEVYIQKTENTCECAICGKVQKGYSFDSGYEFSIGTTCIKHIKLELVK